jgi:signal-transduction protein with cAMP-binding, CBS, and nucleotidyltransferase domain
MGTIADVLAKKGRKVHTIERTATVFDAVRKMVEVNTGSLLVTQGEEPCGIITERDYLRNIVLEGRTSKNTQVREIMTSSVVVIDPSCTVEQAMGIMTQKRIRHLPVVEDGRLTGLVSIGDLVKQVSQDQECQIRYLTDYITGKYPA